MDEATIEERLRPCGSKTRCFCPSETKATRIKASLFYTYCRDCFVATLLATPAQPFSRFFHHTAFAKQGNSTESSGEYV